MGPSLTKIFRKILDYLHTHHFGVQNILESKTYYNHSFIHSIFIIPPGKHQDGYAHLQLHLQLEPISHSPPPICMLLHRKRKW